MKENFSMEWKIFGMEWKCNGRKLPVWNNEKSSSIPLYTIPCWQRKSNKIAYKVNLPDFFYTKHN